MVLVFAVATYFVVRAMQGHRLLPDQLRGGQPRTRRPKPPTPRVIGPDDDEDFLRDLDRKRLNPEDPES